MSATGVNAPGVNVAGASEQWAGAFVAGQLNATIDTSTSSALDVADLVGLALRRNPKRAHLLVSTVLAKHIPTEPALVIAAGGLLGAFVAHAFLTSDAGSPPPQPPSPRPQLAHAAHALGIVLRSAPGQRREAIAALTEEVAALRTELPDAVVIGYAETATGLGRLVANHLGAYYIHSTRHATPGLAPVAGFEEGHSHATSHSMVPTDPHWLAGSGPVVLVDDEFSTGSTVINTIRELHALHPHDTYVVAALIDLRSAADRARFDELAAELGCRISVTALGTGSVDLGADILDRAAALIESLPQAGSAQAGFAQAGSVQTGSVQPGSGQAAPAAAPAAPTPRAGRLSFLELTAGDLTPVRSDRFGNAEPPSAGTIAAVARHVADQLDSLGVQYPVVVLGCEENMFLPVAVAQELDVLRPDANVRFSTTTRSPIVPLDRDDYAIAGALTFASHDLANDGPGVRFAYNLTGTGQRPGTIVVFPEPGTDRHAVTRANHMLKDRNGAALPSLAGALGAAAGDVVVVLLPASTPDPPTEDTP